MHTRALAAAALTLGLAAPALGLTQADIDRTARFATSEVRRITRSLSSNLLLGRDNDTPASQRA